MKRIALMMSCGAIVVAAAVATARAASFLGCPAGGACVSYNPPLHRVLTSTRGASAVYEDRTDGSWDLQGRAAAWGTMNFGYVLGGATSSGCAAAAAGRLAVCSGAFGCVDPEFNSAYYGIYSYSYDSHDHLVGDRIKLNSTYVANRPGTTASATCPGYESLYSLARRQHVACHELGHAAGLDHSADTAGSCMSSSGFALGGDASDYSVVNAAHCGHSDGYGVVPCAVGGCGSLVARPSSGETALPGGYELAEVDPARPSVGRAAPSRRYLVSAGVATPLAFAAASPLEADAVPGFVC
jgi:hypothetical protein